jgi:hypothetical protein
MTKATDQPIDQDADRLREITENQYNEAMSKLHVTVSMSCHNDAACHQIFIHHDHDFCFQGANQKKPVDRRHLKACMDKLTEAGWGVIIDPAGDSLWFCGLCLENNAYDNFFISADERTLM